MPCKSSGINLANNENQRRYDVTSKEQPKKQV